MGIYLNPGNKSFQESIRSKIYVDKTNLIACTNELINTEEKYICISRPRRFGKSMALEMLAAYYSCGCDSKELFAGLKIAQAEAFAEHLNQYAVIYLNMQQFLFEADPGHMTEYLELEVLRELRKTYGKFINREGTETGSWYDGYTFLKFQHVYNPKSVVEAMRRRRYSNYWTSTETYEALKIYMDMDFDGLRPDIVQMLGGGRVRVNTRSFQNDMRDLKIKDDVLTLLIHLGYLGYDSHTQEAFIPNREIMEEFENAMNVGGWSEIISLLKASEKLLADTLAGNAGRVAEELDKAHTQAASILTYHDENSLGCAIGLAYYSARKDYKLIRELPAGKGFADIAFLPLPHTKKPALLVELKYDSSVYTAIQQIKNRQYTQAFENYTGEVLLVGINYKKDDPNKPHSCIIEKTEKI